MNTLLNRIRPITAAVGLSLAFAVTVPATAQDFTPDQKKSIEGVIRDYLLKNPEILQEAFIELEKRQQDAQRTAQRGAVKKESETLFNSPHTIVVGNPKGDVTLVEFFDYNCGYCKRAMDDVAKLMKNDPNLRVVLRDFPVLGPDSVEAAIVALAVKQQIQGEKYFDYHQKLMASKGRVGKDRAIALAKELGLDTARLQKDMEGPQVRAAIQEAMQLGDKLGLTGTPAFIIGEDIIPGAVGFEPLSEAVKSVRQCGKTACS